MFRNNIQYKRINQLLFLVCILSVFFAFSYAQTSIAAMDPRFELDPTSLSVSSVSKSKTLSTKSTVKKSRAGSNKIPTSSERPNIHVVKSGENLFKILMRDYGLTNEEAEELIEEIRIVNNIYDIKRLKVGQKITIPVIRRSPAGYHTSGVTLPSNTFASNVHSQTLKLLPPIIPLPEHEATQRFKQVWDSILPPTEDTLRPILLESPTFSLTLDSKLFPSFSSFNGGRIVVDSTSAIPPLVKALINEKDPTIRLVSESPSEGKKFLSAIVSSAGFYSVEEDFILEFGSDPKLTIHSDFKIEKTSDSLLQQDVVLMNSSRSSIPASITSLLKKDGFTLYEPFASVQPVVPSLLKRIQIIPSNNQSVIIDSLLSSLSVSPDKNTRMEIFGDRNSGIALSVNAERYFVRNGQKNVITRFDGDPVTYTIFRILETMGYQVVILDANDGFKNITEKLLNRLHIQSEFAQHSFGSEFNSNYSVTISGYKLFGQGLPDGGLFVTDLQVDPLIREVLSGSGYTVSSK